MRKRALITGIGGQDGAYLTLLLLSKDYEVHGIIRRKADRNLWRLNQLGITEELITLHTCDVTDAGCMSRLIFWIAPDEIYHLAAQSFVAASFETPLSTFEINATGTLNVLEAARDLQQHSKTPVRFYQASSSEMFGLVKCSSQDEDTPFHPRSPYGVSKLSAHWATINYRETYGLHACCGILFNHESVLRGLEFVSRKIVAGIADILSGKKKDLRLGNIDAIRDWGFAGDYVEAMWLMLQQDKPDDYVIATGESHTVRDMCEIAFGYVNLNYKNFVVIDPKLYRPCEVDELKGNPNKAKSELGWQQKVSFEDMIINMVQTELEYGNISYNKPIKHRSYV